MLGIETTGGRGILVFDCRWTATRPLDPPNQSDSVIDPTTLAETWDACADRLLLIARSIGGPAEDAVQEAFVALASQQHMPEDPMAWLVRVTRNQLLQWQRSGDRRRRRETFAYQQNWFDNEVLKIDQRIDAREVTAALIAMDSPQREVIVMHLWGGLTFEAISPDLGHVACLGASIVPTGAGHTETPVLLGAEFFLHENLP